MKTDNGKQLRRVRKICAALPECEERLSHGEPTFFVKNKVFVMFSNNHHNDGHIAALVPVPEGLQEALINDEPKAYFYPAYVGCRGWVGIELKEVNDETLALHVREAWKLIAPKKLQSAG